MKFRNNVLNESLVEREKILLPPLHIKLGLMKQSVQTLNVNDEYFKHIRNTFPNLTDAKVKEGIFVGPDIAEGNEG